MLFDCARTGVIDESEDDLLLLQELSGTHHLVSADPVIYRPIKAYIQPISSPFKL